jgi:hypothetical protein
MAAFLDPTGPCGGLILDGELPVEAIRRHPWTKVVIAKLSGKRKFLPMSCRVRSPPGRLIWSLPTIAFVAFVC